MLGSSSKRLGSRVVSREEEKEWLQWDGFAEKEGILATSRSSAAKAALYK